METNDRALKAIALIPARAGSQRVKDKNIRVLGEHPLIAYTIAAARLSSVFSDIIVSTDSDLYAEIASYYGAEVPFQRPSSMAGEISPDIEWVRFTLEVLRDMGREYDCFSILRPTSPFRMPETIQRAWKEFISTERIDSLRAVEPCGQHPGKMWVINNSRMTPLFPFSINNTPWHSNPYQILPEIYVQNASLEIAYTSVVFKQGNISGTVIQPFLTSNHEGFDINKEDDWRVAEILINEHTVSLPPISIAPYSKFEER